MKHKKIAFIGIIVLTMATMFYSCNKDESNNDLSLKSTGTSTNLPYFRNIDSLMVAVNTATSFNTISSLLEYEQRQQRVSIGATSDAFYNTIDMSKITNIGQALAFYEEHKAFLDTMVLENSEIAIVPKMFYNPYRYVANEDGMFAVSTYAYKILKSCIVAAPLSYENALRSITDDNLDRADTSIFRFVKETSNDNIDIHEDCIFKWVVKNNPTTPNDRIHIKLHTQTIFNEMVGYVADTRVNVYNLHKWCGFWCTSRHNYTCDASVTFHTISPFSSSWNTNHFQTTKTQKCNSLCVPINGEICNWNALTSWDILLKRYSKYHHYYTYHITASYPGHSIEILTR